MKTRNILSKTTVKLTLITSCAVLLVGLGAFSALDAKATEGKNDKLNIEKATSIALEDSNYKSSDVEMIRSSSDIDDEKTKYEIKFNADGKEYEYEINAKTGEIIDKSVEQIEVKKPVTTEKPAVSTPAQSEPAAETLTADEAKSIALKDANVSSDTTVRVKLDYDDGVSYYDIEFTFDGKEYDYEISAKTGNILDKSVEQVEAKKPVTNNTTNEKPAATTPAQSEPAAETLTADEAKAIALKDANLTDATFVKIELDRDDGVTFYEIEFRSNGYEYEYEVSATTGKVLDRSVDRDDD